MRALLPLLLLVACTEVPLAPCEAIGDPLLELAPVDADFGDFVDGDALLFGTPPQGGAPFTPIRARVSGLEDPALGVSLRVSGTDPNDGADFGEVAYETRMVCSNVGDNAGSYIAADIHFRYYDWSLDELDGRELELVVELSDLHGNSLTESMTGPLQRMP